MRTRAVLFALAALAAACKKNEAKPAEPSPTAPTPGSAAAKPVDAGTVAIYLGDQVVGKLAPEQLALWPRLDTLVPMAARRMGTWQAIALLTTAGKPVEIQQPSSRHPDLIPALFPSESGPAFGMFDPVELATKGKPALREDGIAEVRIKVDDKSERGGNDHQGGDVVDPTKLELTVKSKRGQQVVTGAKLLEVERVPAPGDDEAKGWPLSVILERAGVKGYQKLVLADGKGTNLVLEKTDLDPASSVPYVKLNRQGSLRVIVYKKQGESWQKGGDLRGLAHVEIIE